MWKETDYILKRKLVSFQCKNKIFGDKEKKIH